jgi:hypothetical protein
LTETLLKAFDLTAIDTPAAVPADSSRAAAATPFREDETFPARATLVGENPAERARGRGVARQESVRRDMKELR